MSQFGGVERPGQWETVGDHERRIRALEAYSDCCDNIPEGLLRGCPSVELAYRIQGALTAWWRCGDVFTFGSSVSDALLDSSEFDLDSPRNLNYEEDWPDDRPTLHIPDPDLGSGDDGAFQMNSSTFTDGQRFFKTGSEINAVTYWGTTGNLIQTMVCRIKPNNILGTFEQPYVGRWGMDAPNSVNEGWVLDVASLVLNFKNFNPTSDLVLSTPGALTADQWYSIAVRWDGSLWELLVDGVVLDSAVNTNAPGQSPSDGGFSLGYGLYDLGVSDRQHFGNGGLDEVALYNRPLTDAELLNIAQSHGSGSNTFLCAATVVAGDPGSNPEAISSGDADEFMVLTADGNGNTYWAFPTIEVLEDGS